MRARGLKPFLASDKRQRLASRPMRARGLKRLKFHGAHEVLSRAPCGAWIETSYLTYNPVTRTVAPHEGAWIETKTLTLARSASFVAPMRARGLKLQ